MVRLLAAPAPPASARSIQCRCGGHLGIFFTHLFQGTGRKGSKPGRVALTNVRSGWRPGTGPSRQPLHRPDSGTQADEFAPLKFELMLISPIG